MARRVASPAHRQVDGKGGVGCFGCIVTWLDQPADQWPVARDHHALGVRLPAPHLDHFFAHFGLLPCAGIFEACWVLWVGALDVEVLYIGHRIGDTPGDILIVADDHARCPGEGDAAHRIVWAIEVNFIPDTGNL